MNTPKTMRAVGYYHSLPIEQQDALQDIEVAVPQPGDQDLLVRVKAVSVNPVDYKIRQRVAPASGQANILGWDAVAEVIACGSAVSGFAAGDRVYYAGAIDRPGANSEYHLVDARIAAKAPHSLTDAEAAALPLTAITAWEMLFDRLKLARDTEGPAQTLLVVGAAGGVGSMLIQLARALTGLRVIATAARPESRDWCLQMGAHAVIDHRQPLAAQLAELGISELDMVASLTHSGDYFAQYVDCLKAQGQIALIDDLEELNAVPLKRKSISLHWEMMFTRSLYQTADLAEQGRLLAEVAALADQGRIRSTLTSSAGTINAASLRAAHALLERGSMIGKLVLCGFD